MRPIPRYLGCAYLYDIAMRYLGCAYLYDIAKRYLGCAYILSIDDQEWQL